MSDFQSCMWTSHYPDLKFLFDLLFVLLGHYGQQSIATDNFSVKKSLEIFCSPLTCVNEINEDNPTVFFPQDLQCAII